MKTSGASVRQSTVDNDISRKASEEIEICLAPDEVFKIWVCATIRLENGHIVVEQNGVDILSVSLSDQPTILKIHEESSNRIVIMAIKGKDAKFWVKMTTMRQDVWAKSLREEMIRLSVTGAESDLPKGLKGMLEQYNAMLGEDSGFCDEFDVTDMTHTKSLSIPPPSMNIVILVVGTRGDVQPFAYLGQALQKDGHRVRLATHAEYRDYVVREAGLEFYPLAGDPRKLSEYMVS